MTAAELGWYSIACSPNPPTLLLALLLETIGSKNVLVFAMLFHEEGGNDVRGKGFVMLLQNVLSVAADI